MRLLAMYGRISTLLIYIGMLTASSWAILSFWMGILTHQLTMEDPHYYVVPITYKTKNRFKVQVALDRLLICT